MKYNYKPTKYFSLSLGITTLFWLIGGYYSFSKDDSFYMLFMLLGLMSPFIISLFMVKSKKEMLVRVVDFRLINIKFLPLIILIMPLSVVLAIGASLLLGESSAQFEIAKEFQFSTGFIPILFLFLLAAVFEELGWRGYGFESLYERFNLFYASLFFSILWSIWHLPLLFVNNSYQYEIFNENPVYALNFFISVIPMGFIISWICIKNNKSILIAIFFHYIINFSQEFFSITQTTKILQALILVLFVVFIVLYDKELFFSKSDTNEK